MKGGREKSLKDNKRSNNVIYHSQGTLDNHSLPYMHQIIKSLELLIITTAQKEPTNKFNSQRRFPPNSTRTKHDSFDKIVF